MTKGRTDELTFDSTEATELLLHGHDPEDANRVDRCTEAIVEEYRREQESGYDELVHNKRAWTVSHVRKDDIAHVLSCAERVREQFAVFVLVGIGGSDLGARALHDALDHPYHNRLDPTWRPGAPEIYFTGDTFDPKRLTGLLDMLERVGMLDKTCINVVSKSGTTGETITAAMIIRDALRRAGVADWHKHVVATTGFDRHSVLYRIHHKTPFLDALPVPDGVGGRFSFASPVGLLPFAITTTERTPLERLASALVGYAEAHRRSTLAATDGHNIAARLASWLHLGEYLAGKTGLLFCNYADDSELANWFVQLYSESVQERGRGLNVLPTRGPTGNHSILNGVLRGAKDKLALFVEWSDLGSDLAVPEDLGAGESLSAFEGLPLARVQSASCRATVADYLANGVPTATLRVARRDARHVFMLMRTLMDAVAIKGRLQNLHINDDGVEDPSSDLTYLQNGVEGYKIRTVEIAREEQKEMRAG